MVDLGIEVPAGHSLVSLVERPDLVERAGDFIPFAAAPVAIDRAADEGVSFDPNVWMVHSVD